jgi:hypothetical protein
MWKPDLLLLGNSFILKDRIRKAKENSFDHYLTLFYLLMYYIIGYYPYWSRFLLYNVDRILLQTLIQLNQTSYQECP